MSHSKKGIRVTNSSGEVSWTSKRGARRMIARRTGALQPDGSLLMCEADYRFASPAAWGTHFENLAVLMRPFPIDLHYQDDRAVLKYWPDQGCGGIEA